MAELTVYPAIDLRGGQVVRLVQGDPARETVYGKDVAAIAGRWAEAGARWLHIVDLDAALGEPREGNRRALEAIERAVGRAVRLQVGGGLRTEADVAAILDLGAARVVLGTAAVEQHALLAKLLARYGPGRVAAGIDARDGRVRVRGWTEAAGVTPMGLARQLAEAGLRTAIYTDIARDGAGTGVNVAAARRLADASGLEVIAAGGVASLDDIRRVRAAGVAGVIVGRALYEGQIDLGRALAVAGEEEN